MFTVCFLFPPFCLAIAIAVGLMAVYQTFKRRSPPLGGPRPPRLASCLRPTWPRPYPDPRSSDWLLGVWMLHMFPDQQQQAIGKQKIKKKRTRKKNKNENINSRKITHIRIAFEGLGGVAWSMAGNLGGVKRVPRGGGGVVVMSGRSHAPRELGNWKRSWRRAIDSMAASYLQRPLALFMARWFIYHLCAQPHAAKKMHWKKCGATV